MITHSSAEQAWYILYTTARAEKKVHTRLLQGGIHCYLPMHKTLKQWSDRKKWVEEPLFRSYLFVQCEPSQYFSILNTPGAVKFIHFGGQIATIRQQKIDEIKLLLSNFSEVELVPSAAIYPADQVMVIAGPLQGLSGKALHYKGKQVLAVEIEQIEHSLIVQFPLAYLQKA